MRRIQAVSRALRSVLFAALILQAAGFLALLVAAATFSLTKLKSQTVFENYCALATLPFTFMVTLHFLRFFDQLKRGQLFDLPAVKHLQAAGWWWIGIGIVQATCAALEAYLFAPHSLKLPGDGIIAGLTVVFIAWIMEEGRKMQEEQRLTV